MYKKINCSLQVISSGWGYFLSEAYHKHFIEEQITVIWWVCVCVFIYVGVCAHTQMCPILCNPMNCSPPGSPVYGISQERIPEWVAISFSRGYPRIEPTSLASPALSGRFFTTTAEEKPQFRELYVLLFSF